MLKPRPPTGSVMFNQAPAAQPSSSSSTAAFLHVDVVQHTHRGEAAPAAREAGVADEVRPFLDRHIPPPAARPKNSLR